MRSQRIHTSDELSIDLFEVAGGHALFFYLWEEPKNWEGLAGEWVDRLQVGDVVAMGGALKTGKTSVPLPTLLNQDPLWAKEGNLELRIRMEGVLNPGLFLDQRLNRVRLRRLMRDLDLKGASLNLFSYTGAFSLLARSQGLTTTSVDVSKKYLEWEKENHLKNFGDLEGALFFKKDAREYLKKAKKKYSLIVLDPPSFSRGDKGPMQVRRDLPPMVERAMELLEDSGIILVSSNLETWEPDEFLEEFTKLGKMSGLTAQSGETPPLHPPLNSIFLWR